MLVSVSFTNLQLYPRHSAVSGKWSLCRSTFPFACAILCSRKRLHNHLIIPGPDLHAHAPQIRFPVPWEWDLELFNTAERAEARYADFDCAQRAYTIFTDDLRGVQTARAVLLGTLHVPATLMLMQLLEQSGLWPKSGKVNMDRDSPDMLRETDAQSALASTRDWLAHCVTFGAVSPYSPPRFSLPSCSDALMEGLHILQKETGLPVQSHSENQSEIAWVRQLIPKSAVIVQMPMTDLVCLAAEIISSTASGRMWARPDETKRCVYCTLSTIQSQFILVESAPI